MQSNVKHTSDVELKGVPMTADADADAIAAPLLVVVGAGPVGCTTALAFAKEGWKVAVYEGRADIRLSSSQKVLAQRSVNLALSSRGLAALYSIEPTLMDRILDRAIPMKGRLLHLAGGKTESQLYDPSKQCIHSIDRGLLNQVLLQEAINCPAIEVHFEHKLTTADFDRRVLTFSTPKEEKPLDVHFDLCVGADGSYSNVRRQMMRVVRMDYEQQYIPHDYIELKIPAGVDESGKRYFLLDPNHLHVWPRHSFMLVALPNEDKSFTSTLFAPTSDLAKLDSRRKALEWLKEHFPDAVSLVEEETLLNDFERNPRNSLISLQPRIKKKNEHKKQAKPYHYEDRCIILGDAAHSMVPFYGQGLNCGLEDIRVLMNILRNEGAIQPRKRRGEVDENLKRAFVRYSETRHDDLVAICDLAMNNYVEMRHSVTTPSYIFRKMIDNVFSSLTAPHLSFLSLTPNLAKEPTGFCPAAPRGWLPLYSMVAFRPDLSYGMVKRKAERQNAIIRGIGIASVGFCIGFAGIRVLLGFSLKNNLVLGNA